MAGLYISNLAQINVETKTITASSGGLLFTGVDLKNIPGGAIVVNVFAVTGGTGTTTITLEHSVDNSTWATVPAGAVLNNNTGVVTTLSTFSTTGTNQQVAVNRELLRRYFRINITGTTITQNVTLVVTGIAANTATA
jgi:hypothetical protein